MTNTGWDQHEGRGTTTLRLSSSVHGVRKLFTRLSESCEVSGETTEEVFRAGETRFLRWSLGEARGFPRVEDDGIELLAPRRLRGFGPGRSSAGHDNRAIDRFVVALVFGLDVIELTFGFGRCLFYFDLNGLGRSPSATRPANNYNYYLSVNG